MVLRFGPLSRDTLADCLRNGCKRLLYLPLLLYETYWRLLCLPGLGTLLVINPATGLKLEQVYGCLVLLSGLGSLILTKPELSKKHYSTFSTCFPASCVLFSWWVLRQFSLLAMITSEVTMAFS